MTALPQEYFETHFRCADYKDEWPNEFVIITAYATTGETWPLERNLEADRELEAELFRRGLWLKRVTGYSPLTGHAEPGWATNLGIIDGCILGHKFAQHAIYHVRDDELSVALCDQPENLVSVGRFTDRVS